jgi:hypothetical protein
MMFQYKEHRNGINSEDDEFPILHSGNSRERCYRYLIVYVRIKDFVVEEFKLDMHKSLGGQCRVFCKCLGINLPNTPLILVGTRREKRSYCASCGKNREKYHCPVPGCSTSICKKCYDEINSSLDHGKMHVFDPLEFQSNTLCGEILDSCSVTDTGDSAFSTLDTEEDGDCSSLGFDSDCSENEVCSLIMDKYQVQNDDRERTNLGLEESDKDGDGSVNNHQTRRTVMENNFLTAFSISKVLMAILINIQGLR